MNGASLVLAALLSVVGVVATECGFEKDLQIPPRFEGAVTSFCDRVVETPSWGRSNNAPPPLSAFLSSAGLQAEVSSVCSCLVCHHSTSTCPTKTLTVSIPYTMCTAKTKSVTVTDTITVTDTVTTTTTDDISVTGTTTASSTTTTTTTTTTTATDDISVTATTTTASTTTTTTTTSTTSTTTDETTTTVTSQPSPVAVDQNGCPAVQGSNFESYIIYCNSGAGSGSFAYGTNPGYNIEDCASQCFDDPDGVDCLAVTYTQPAGGAFSIIDGHLMPGTCTFFEFVTAAVPDAGVALGVFENTFARKRLKKRKGVGF